MTASLSTFAPLQALLTASDSRAALNQDAAYRDRLFAELDRLLASNDMVGTDAILSLDIFDTLLLRDDSSELRRFWEIGAAMAAAVDALRAENGRACPPVDQAEGFLLRYLGTHATYRASPLVAGCREGCLGEIHRTASRMVAGVTPADADRLHEAFLTAEFAHEATRLTPAAALIAYVERHRRRGGRTILITDMYMRELHIRRLLALVGVDAALFDSILSSADHKVSKASGGIFAIAEEMMGQHATGFVHVGDNPDGDVRRPIAHGWRALHLPIADAERRRRRIDHFTLLDDIFAEYGFVADVAAPD